MGYKPSDSYCKEFVTANPSTGAAQNADSTPAATANRNGADDGAFALTVANLDTGRYKITGTIPSGYAKGDAVNVTVAATVASVAGKACVDTFVLDSKRVGDLNDVGGTAQTGDSFARIGSNGAGLTAVGDTSGTTTLLSRLTAARSGYLDNLNVGGNVASHADVLAINTSSSKHLILTTVGQYERPESGSTVYTVECRTYAAADGSAVNADTTPTLTATGQTSGSLAANLGSATSPATGVYRWAYTVASNATAEPIRFDVAATISSSAFTLSCYSQVVDEVSATWTSTDASHLTAVFNQLPSGTMLDASGVQGAVGLGAANLDTQLNAIYTVAGEVQAKTDNLPSSPASTSDITDLIPARLLMTNGRVWAKDGEGNDVAPALTALSQSSLDNLAAHGDNSWATATGFSTLTAPAVWDLASSGHTTSGTFGAAMAAAGTGGDPWATVGEVGLTYGQLVQYAAAAAVGNLAETSDHAATTIAAAGNPGTPRITSVNTPAGRAVTLH